MKHKSSTYIFEKISGSLGVIILNSNGIMKTGEDIFSISLKQNWIRNNNFGFQNAMRNKNKNLQILKFN